MINYEQRKTTDGGDVVTIKHMQHQHHAGRRTIVNHRTTHNGSAAVDTRDDIVELWRRAIQGDAAARRAFQQRVGRDHTILTEPVIMGFVPLPARHELANASE